MEKNKDREESLVELAPFSIFKKDIAVQEKLNRKEKLKRFRLYFFVLLITILLGTSLLNKNGKYVPPTCDDGYQLASDYELTNPNECGEYFDEGEAKECCEVYILEDLGDVDDYFLPKDSFMGYECTDDCSGHQAGYNWALESGVYSKDDCTGNSQSFIEGCYAYVEENF
jgi:hypothetical protein